MPIDDLTALGQKMREARKKKDLTQQELADLSHVSVKQIASMHKGQNQYLPEKEGAEAHGALDRFRRSLPGAVAGGTPAHPNRGGSAPYP